MKINREINARYKPKRLHLKPGNSKIDQQKRSPETANKNRFG